LVYDKFDSSAESTTELVGVKQAFDGNMKVGKGVEKQKLGKQKRYKKNAKETKS